MKQIETLADIKQGDILYDKYYFDNYGVKSFCMITREVPMHTIVPIQVHYLKPANMGYLKSIDKNVLLSRVVYNFETIKKDFFVVSKAAARNNNE